MSIGQWRAIFERLEALEKRVAELEAPPSVLFANTDTQIMTYQGHQVTWEPDPIPSPAPGYLRVGEPVKRGPGRPRKEPVNGQ